MEVARITVSSVYAKAETAMPITSGMIGARVRLVYLDPMWEGLKKTVVFYGAVVKDVVTDDELVEIPPECVSRPGVPLKIGVYGVDAAGNTVIPTVVGEIGRVKQGADPSGDTSTDKTLPVWAEVRAAIGDLNTLETEDKSSLVAAVNEVKANSPRYLTQEEYNALPEAEKASGTFVIVDYINQTDPTLTEAGMAADAKSVGDRLALLENALGTGLAELDALIGGDG